MILFAKLTATFCGIGYFPVAPGTAATAAGIVLVFLLQGCGAAVYLGIVLALFIAGVWAGDCLEKSLGKKDPGIVVIDEVVGIMIGLMGLPMGWPMVICGFFLFRALDMFKIYPINRLEAQPGGWGIMADDVMAGIYTNIIMHIALRWAGI